MKTNKPYQKVKILGIFLILMASFRAGSQSADSVNIYYVRTTAYRNYVGPIIRQDSSAIVLKTKRSDSLEIRRSLINHMERIDPARFKRGKYWPDYPQTSRYFWLPNGYGLNRGEGYYQNIYGLVNQVSLGITDYFSVATGCLPLWFGKFGQQTFWLAPEFSVPAVKNKLCVSGSLLILGEFDNRNSALEVPYGSFTLGPKNFNLSLGLGFAHSHNGWTRKPVITMSGMFRVIPAISLIAETYYIPLSDEYFDIMLLGGSIMFRWVSLELGMTILDFDKWYARDFYPYAGLSIPFGHYHNRRNR